MKKNFKNAPDYEPGKTPRCYRLHDIDYLDELEDVWGKNWGAQSEIGQLKKVMVSLPTPNENAEEYKQDMAYWGLDQGLPDLDLMQEQYHELVEILEGEGVDVVVLQVPDESYGPYSRHRLLWAPASCFVIKGGAIIPRYGLAAWRRGHEVYLYKKMAEIGCPILFTTHGKGVLELGGNGQFLDSETMLFGIGPSCNREGLKQVRPILKRQGIKEIHETFFTGVIHLDLVFGMADAWLGVAYTDDIDHETRKYLDQKGLEIIEVSEVEMKHSACNTEVLEPGKVILSEECNETRRALEREGVEVISWKCSEYIKTGGGPHCATSELIREPGPTLEKNS